MIQENSRWLVRRWLWLILIAIAVIMPTFAAGLSQSPKLFLWLVPSSDGCGIFLTAKVVGGDGTPTEGIVCLSTEGIVCGRICEPMDCDAWSCTALLTCFLPGTSAVEGTVSVTLTLSPTQTLETGPVSFRRFFVPTTGAAPIVSPDENLEMTLSDHSLPADAYAVVMATGAAPGPVPWGHRLVGQPYSVRASGAVVTSTKPMLLKLFYTDTTLGGVDPHTLSILQWNPMSQEWDDLGGNLDDAIEHSVSTTTKRFTVYALMATTRWRDVFNDLTGLSEWDHVTVLLPNGELVLDGLAYTGTATSRAITPTIWIEEWGHVTFTRTVPAETNLTIDVLSADGTPLLGDVTSGANLASIDATVHPSLRLKAVFSTDDLARSASLDEWSITWQPRSCRIYLPVVLRQ